MGGVEVAPPLPPLFLTPAGLLEYDGEAMKQYIWNLLVAADQFLNTVAGGSPEETISSRAGKLADRGNRAAQWFCRVIGWVLGPGHCHRSEEWEKKE